MGLAEILAGVNPLPPTPPTALAATSVNSSTINISWADNSANELGFQVQRCDGTLAACNANPSFVPILEVGPNVTSFADTTLFPITTYTYRVRAFNLDGYSFDSNPAAATTLQQGPPPAPTNLVASRSWSASRPRSNSPGRTIRRTRTRSRSSGARDQPARTSRSSERSR